MKIAIVGHGPSLLHSPCGPEIDAYDFIVRLKRSWDLPVSYSKFYGSKTDAVCGSLTLGQAMIQPWYEKGVREFWLFSDSRHEDWPETVERDLNVRYQNVHIDRDMCRYWREKYRGLRHWNERSQQQVQSDKLSDDLGHLHQSAGSHAIMYAMARKPRSIALFGFDSLLSGKFTWSITRGPSYNQYPDHNWEAERQLFGELCRHFQYNEAVLTDNKLEVIHAP